MMKNPIPGVDYTTNVFSPEFAEKLIREGAEQELSPQEALDNFVISFLNEDFGTDSSEDTTETQP